MRWRTFFVALSLALALPHDAAFAASAMPQCKVAFQRNLKSHAIKLLRMRLKSGTSCRFAIPYKRGVMIKEMRLVKKPERGRVTNLNRGSLVYHAPKTAGRDVFAVAFLGSSHTVTGGGAFAFNVDVR